MIQQLSTHGTDNALGRSVLPWTSERGSFWIDAEARDRARDCGREDREPAKLAKRLRLRRGESLIHKRLASRAG